MIIKNTIYIDSEIILNRLASLFCQRMCTTLFKCSSESCRSSKFYFILLWFPNYHFLFFQACFCEQSNFWTFDIHCHICSRLEDWSGDSFSRIYSDFGRNGEFYKLHKHKLSSTFPTSPNTSGMIGISGPQWSFWIRKS